MVPLALLQVLGRAFGRMFCLSLEWLVGIHTGVRGCPPCGDGGGGGGELSQHVWLVWFGWNESNKVPFKPNMESGFLHELTCFGSTDFHALKPRTCTERLRSRVAKKASILVSKFQLWFLVFSRLTCRLITVYFCKSLEQSGAKQSPKNLRKACTLLNVIEPWVWIHDFRCYENPKFLGSRIISMGWFASSRLGHEELEGELPKRRLSIEVRGTRVPSVKMVHLTLLGGFDGEKLRLFPFIFSRRMYNSVEFLVVLLVRAAWKFLWFFSREQIMLEIDLPMADSFPFDVFDDWRVLSRSA